MKQSQFNIDASIWSTLANKTISEMIDFFIVTVNTCHQVGFPWKHSITVSISDCSSTISINVQLNMLAEGLHVAVMYDRRYNKVYCFAIVLLQVLILHSHK